MKLAPAKTHVAPAKSVTVALNDDASVATATGKPGEGCFDCLLQDPTADGQGHSLPAEMLPESIDFDGRPFPSRAFRQQQRLAISAWADLSASSALNILIPSTSPAAASPHGMTSRPISSLHKSTHASMPLNGMDISGNGTTAAGISTGRLFLPSPDPQPSPPHAR